LKRILFAAGAAVLATLFSVAGALAITNGEPDGNRHPEVGALLAPQAFPDGTWEECSGTLIAPNVFLTAAHCDEGLSRVEVTFASVFDRQRSTTYWGTWHADPGFTSSQSDRTTSPSSSSTRRSKASHPRGCRLRALLPA
jgi:Trypsin